MRILLKVIGYFIIIFSLTFLLVYISMLIGGDDDRGVIIGLIALLTGTGLFGGYLIKIANRRQLEGQEKMVLRIAAARGGKVTPEEVAMETSLTVNDAQKLLEELCTQGAGQLQVTDQGGLIYTFSGLLSETERDSAQSPLDD
ncbi:MAG: hypothetical protein HOC74_32420 [Gemmatimonadetes bacterium]|jgi:hypothetical protein|nr:hypothetical protein [Gemmatimonadota bacterium]